MLLLLDRQSRVQFGTANALETGTVAHNASMHTNSAQHDFLVYISDHSNTEIITQYADFHGRDAKPIVTQRPKSKSRSDHEYVIILQH